MQFSPTSVRFLSDSAPAVDVTYPQGEKPIRHFSYPGPNFIFSKKEHLLDNHLSIAGHRECDKQRRQKSNHELTVLEKHVNIEKAQQYFADSGILGTTSHSCELIRKTSKIHLDPSLQKQIRKTSLSLRSKTSMGTCLILSRLTNCKTTESSIDKRILNIKSQVCVLKEEMAIGETKFLTLRVEANKLKKALQEVMHTALTCDYDSNNLFLENRNRCVFCQDVSAVQWGPMKL
ncbi:uncharacterized protein LOC117134975 [Drosophila busckii]|uniref:uncharacterized protein LOC117134975 n=1 Tax=Drosophila busckii TaxID=30019 RepID=UPI0014333114|nr:uncharacterized protein LOC117134975 [Drosophila busckii]